VINLSSTQTLRVLIAQLSAVDVHYNISYVDLDLVGGVITPGEVHGSFSAFNAAYQTICGSPAANTIRNVKSICIYNKNATLVSPIQVAKTDSPSDFPMRKDTLLPEQTLLYEEGSGWSLYGSNTPGERHNSSTADQVLTASVATSVAGSAINAANVKIGTTFRWRIIMGKTAAGIASQTFDVKFGTAGAVGDTSRLLMGGTGTQTAVADVAEVDIQVVVRSLGATGTVHGSMTIAHNLASTGFAPTPNVVNFVLSGTFDLTVANLIASIATTSGASSVTTLYEVFADRYDPLV
jgi:hypothetical protein